MFLKSSAKNLPAHCVRPATAILGDKWTPLLLQFLYQSETARFCHIQDSLGGINPRTLSARLSKLESQGIITKRTYSEVPPRTEYCLTKKGLDLVPILQQMRQWSERYS